MSLVHNAIPGDAIWARSDIQVVLSVPSLLTLGTGSHWRAPGQCCALVWPEHSQIGLCRTAVYTVGKQLDTREEDAQTRCIRRSGRIVATIKVGGLKGLSQRVEAHKGFWIRDRWKGSFFLRASRTQICFPCD